MTCDDCKYSSNCNNIDFDNKICADFEKIDNDNDNGNDNVNHPKHYTSHPSGVECITIAKHYGFFIGNAIKYLWRAGLKRQDTHVEDLRKAIWYIEQKIKDLEENENGK